MSDELIGRVTGVIAKTQHIAPESVTIDKTFEELKIDSLDGINILFALESEFDVDIPDDAARQIRSVREMVDGIEKLLAAKAAKAAEGAGSGAAESPAESRAAE
jgi:acyl carrier protein